ncbi:OpgC domain-containing protein [Bradyrhizobium sp. BR 10289]|uniref:OpgC domain-containing protein n=1 Tax=Bradyrhizobium sp. BR 10289 TaxID=2749993 RepID=UPI001C64C384|nr:OpgC domain-containing protein [Bradyrhizobium sp. BR 10289]MBW7971191.1 OpgC domain-containing protein [Bradyrhizobium sp. BR 10289]
MKWSVATPPPLIERDLRIDLFRGLSLWWIFIDHIPESYLNHFTPKNFGFSDAAEILVFLSGLASGIVYGDIARRSGLAVACLRIFRRSFEIYAAYVVTLVFLLGEVSYLAAYQTSMLDHANLAIMLEKPADTLFQALLLRYSPVNLDPLLLMVTLHFALLAILPAVMRAWPLALTGSIALYLLSHKFDWYMDAYPTGQIYFNPLNWQLLFVIGICWGASRGRWQSAILRSETLAASSVVYLVFSLLITLGWQVHSIEAYVPGWLSRLIYPVDKSNLDILRLMHFMALALLCWRFLPSNLDILRARALRPLVQCGEYALVIYCVGVLLSFAGHAVLNLGWNSLVSQTLVTLAGLVIMSAIATLLAAMNRAALPVHPRPL